jgi:hypothetical protein
MLHYELYSSLLAYYSQATNLEHHQTFSKVFTTSRKQYECTTVMKVNLLIRQRVKWVKVPGTGKTVSMRLWEDEQPDELTWTLREYETVGYVIKGKAELHIGVR